MFLKNEKLFFFSIREINDKLVRSSSSFLDLAYRHHILAILNTIKNISSLYQETFENELIYRASC